MAKSRFGKSILIWGIVAVMVFGLGGLGLNQVLQQTRSGVVITVGKTEVNAPEYYQALVNAMNRVAQEQGVRMSIDDARLAGVVDDVRTQLLNAAILEEIARVYNLRVPDSAVAAELRKNPSFLRTDGSFNDIIFEQFLSANRISEADYFDTIRKELKRQMVINIIAASHMDLPAMSAELAAGIGEERLIEFVAITSDDVGEIAPASEEQARAQYDANPDLYLGSPSRQLEVAYALADADAVSEDEARAYFQEHKSEFGRPASVDYEVLAFPSEDEARAAIETDFAIIAAERGLDLVDYQFANQDVSSIADQAALEAILSGETGVLAPVQALLGWNLYNIIAYRPAEEVRFEDVEREIRQQLANDALNAELSANYQALSDLVGAGVAPKDLAEAIDFQYASLTLGQNKIAGLTDDDEFLQEAIAAQIEEVRDLVKLRNGGVAYFRVMSEGDAATLPFEEVKDEILANLNDQALNDALDLRAEALLAEAQNGASLSEVAAANALEMRVAGPLNQQEILREAPLAIAFEAFQREPNSYWVSNEGAARYLSFVKAVVALDQNSEAGRELIGGVNDQLNAQIADSTILALLNALAREWDARINIGVAEQTERQVR